MKIVRNNDLGQVEFSMFVHSSRGTAVISANSLMDAVQVNVEIDRNNQKQHQYKLGIPFLI